jgi:hypothetical protein
VIAKKVGVTFDEHPLAVRNNNIPSHCSILWLTNLFNETYKSGHPKQTLINVLLSFITKGIYSSPTSSSFDNSSESDPNCQ